MHHDLSSSNLLMSLPCWRGPKDSRELYQGNLSKPHMLQNPTRTLSPCVWSFSHKKRSDTKSPLVLILLAENCSLYIFPWFLRKPAGLADYSTSLSHTWNDALLQENGTKIFLQIYLTCLVVGFGFSPKFYVCVCVVWVFLININTTVRHYLFFCSVFNPKVNHQSWIK